MDIFKVLISLMLAALIIFIVGCNDNSTVLKNEVPTATISTNFTTVAVAVTLSEDASLVLNNVTIEESGGGVGRQRCPPRTP